MQFFKSFATFKFDAIVFRTLEFQNSRIWTVKCMFCLTANILNFLHKFITSLFFCKNYVKPTHFFHTLLDFSWNQLSCNLWRSNNVDLTEKMFSKFTSTHSTLCYIYTYISRSSVQCGNFRTFLLLRFYVKSKFVNLESQNLLNTLRESELRF